MKFHLKAIFVWIGITVVIFSPMYIIELYENIQVIYFSSQYVKMRIKVDSIYVASVTSSDGGSSLSYHYFYNKQYNVKLCLADTEKGEIAKLFGEKPKPLDAYNDLRANNDSIWIWYHPEGVIRYAKKPEKKFSIKKNVVLLIVNSILLSFSVYAIAWQIQYYRKKKAKNIRYDKT